MAVAFCFMERAEPNSALCPFSRQRQHTANGEEENDEEKGAAVVVGGLRQCPKPETSIGDRRRGRNTAAGRLSHFP